MGKVYDTIDANIAGWIAQQKMFFVSTAPLAANGHINCSPKGSDTFRVLNEHEAAYLDLTGSGAETIAHLQENGRIVVMFCAFDGAPRIVRLHGTGRVIYPGAQDWASLLPLFPANVGARAIIRVEVRRISDSCGYAVPKFDFVGSRDVLDKWALNKSPNELEDYRNAKNAQSIDGLPGYKKCT